MSLEVWAGAPYRGSTTQAEVTFPVKSISLTESWGAQPGVAMIEYAPEQATNETVALTGIAVGAAVTVTAPGHVFQGVCIEDVLKQGSSGRTRLLRVHDLRELLKWDMVYGAFNMPEDTMVDIGGGVLRRRRRYWHILPANATAHLKTWTDAPYSALFILGALLSAPTVPGPWYPARYNNNLLTPPVFGLDFMGGRRLDEALTQVSERLGLVFKWHGVRNLGGTTYWDLYWHRKGTGPAPLPLLANGQIDWSGVEACDDCEEGWNLTERPTWVRVWGSRNRYQLANVTLVPDWNAAWHAFYDADLLIDYVFHHCTDESGTIFANRVDAGDPDQIIARQMATARAHEITVRELAAVAGSALMDYRRFNGQWRADMPAMLYISTILFRAFKLPSTITVNGATVNTAAGLEIEDRLLAQVTHDPSTGVMTPDASAPVSGGIYAIAQGYQLGRDFFERVHPARFDVATWTGRQALWQKVPCRLDDAGDGTRLILFDQPLVQSTNLVTNVNGWTVFNAAATFSVPAVRATVVVQAERFFLDAGDLEVGVDNGPMYTANEPDLYEEFLYDLLSPAGETNPTVLPMANGQTATQAAAALATALLDGQHIMQRGSYRRYLADGDAGTALTGMIDRVELRCSPEGVYETVYLTAEQGRRVFLPERDYDRVQRDRSLFPGQDELRAKARQLALSAIGLKQTPGFLQELYRAFYGLGSPRALARVTMASGTGTLRAGTPLWRAPSVNTDGRLSNVQAALPTAVADADRVFAGATVREGENAAAPVAAATEGTVLLRVQGPVAVGDVVGRAPISPGANQDFLTADSEYPVGQVRQAIGDSSVQLVEVSIGVASSGLQRIVWQ